jgi:site-specific DNA-methyltransferase (adenine-specific)
MVGATSPVKENNEWATPQWFFDYFNSIYDFKVDLAATDRNTKCGIYLTKAQNSLNQDWSQYKGWLWCNPPYGRQLPQWVEKAYIEMKKGAKICMLIPASVGTNYWAKYIINKVPFIWFIEGRIRFVDPLSQITDPPKYDSALIVFNLIDEKKTEITSIDLKIIKK